MKDLLLLLGVICLCGCKKLITLAGEPLTGPNVFILAGQSNMVGTAFDVPFDRGEQSIRMLGNDGIWKQASDPLDDPANQVDAVSRDDPSYVGVGAGMTFARDLVHANPQMQVLLVPCAKASTVLWMWNPSPSRSTLYGSMIARAKEAQTKGQLAGLIWWQGESDRDRTTYQTNDYARDLVNFIRSVRLDLQTPNLPVIIVQLHNHPPANDRGMWDGIKSEQEKAVQALTNAALVKTDDQPVQTITPLHLTGVGYITVGHRIAKAYEELMHSR